MVIKEKRTRLDKALSNQRLTVLLLSGTKESKAGKIHNAFVAFKWERSYRCILITDLSLLTKSERTKWFDGAKVDRYAVLKGTNLPKRLASKGPVENLLRVRDSRPDRIKIRRAIIN